MLHSRSCHIPSLFLIVWKDGIEIDKNTVFYCSRVYSLYINIAILHQQHKYP